jgi:hypothetical protein
MLSCRGGLPPHVQRLLLLNSVDSLEDLVVLTVEQLQAKTRLPLHLCAQVLDMTYTQLMPSPKTLWELSRPGPEEADNQVLQTGQPALDDILGGGLRVGTLTELYGESGGKAHPGSSHGIPVDLVAQNKKKIQ